MHSHHFRQTWAQTALRKAAERAIVQDAMGWSSDRMARRYEDGCGGTPLRRDTAAAAMRRFRARAKATTFPNLQSRLDNN